MNNQYYTISELEHISRLVDESLELSKAKHSLDECKKLKTTGVQPSAYSTKLSKAELQRRAMKDIKQALLDCR